ncbi:MAG: (Fe-S)-binding protein [Flavobacteriaceae bacterium]|jgi:heterodisulfide reductase subunit C|nr:(Fe-S)-binding protein [Flavobacteriaceae bacterium]MBT4112563.1 (Fe-S)-binding protein [Flavobacteriaceae bacterium]MBT4614417.1 (Fe-S)-binding protein [Flavobacteriaceae bacterium]MBT5246870.1 (Fe-S)-binding protein [Flavobacteriaceae bacterium]MBT5650055.1 (Fe-S)-binding protein [Flavobacteriaceae bacterium]
MSYLPNITFFLILFLSLGYFISNFIKLRRNINLGIDLDIDLSVNRKQRWANMAKIALGQSKMVRRPIVGALHVIVYVGFIIINIELLEIVIDGLIGTHRVFSGMGVFYGFLIASFEILAVLVLIAVSVFWIRRNIIKVKRFFENSMKGWPKLDADLILYFEIILMSLFLLMNTTDVAFQNMNNGNIVSGYIYPLFENYSVEALHMMERTFWWMHIIGVLLFLNYLYFSKHLHILLAFPNTFYASLENKGMMGNLKSVTKEVNLMLNDSSTDQEENFEENSNEMMKFGASDVSDLNWLQLLNAYSCTECGRCTSVCPANITGKKLSPRKIMMNTRDRLEEVSRNIDKNKGSFVNDGKKLIDDYISREELWACTSCNACVEECPISIDPLSIILDMRRYLVMEEASAPAELNNMMSNIENNGAPWPYNQMDRLNWKDESL